METRREIKRQITSCGTLLRNAKNLTVNEHDDILRELANCIGQLEDLDCTAGDEYLISDRRIELKDNASLHDIFSILWALVQDYCDGLGYLQKEGYVKLHRALQCALHGPSPLTTNFDKKQIDLEWENDRVCFGPLNRLSFFDSLFENIESLTDLVDPFYYPSFMWALLDAIADTRKFPPRFRAYTEIKCFINHPNQAELYESYREKKPLRVAMHITSEWMTRVPEIQKRLRGRREGRTITPDQASLVVNLSGTQRPTRGNDRVPLADSTLTSPEETPPVSSRHLESTYCRTGTPPLVVANMPAPAPVPSTPELVVPAAQEEEESVEGSVGSMNDSPVSRPSTQESRRLAAELHKQGLWEPAGAVYHTDVVQRLSASEVNGEAGGESVSENPAQRRRAKARPKAINGEGGAVGSRADSSLMSSDDGVGGYRDEDSTGEEEEKEEQKLTDEEDGRPRWTNSFGVPQQSSVELLGINVNGGDARVLQEKHVGKSGNSFNSVDGVHAPEGISNLHCDSAASGNDSSDKNSRPQWGQALLSVPPVIIPTPREACVDEKKKSDFHQRFTNPNGTFRVKPPNRKGSTACKVAKRTPSAPSAEAIAISGGHALLEAQARTGASQDGAYEEQVPVRVLKPTPARDQRPVLVAREYQPYEDPVEEPPLPEGVVKSRFGLIKKELESHHHPTRTTADRFSGAHHPVGKALEPIRVGQANVDVVVCENECEVASTQNPPRRAAKEQDDQRVVNESHQRFLREQEDAQNEYMYALYPSRRPVREIDKFLASYEPPKAENPALESAMDRIGTASLSVVDDRELHDSIRGRRPPVSSESVIPANYRSVSPTSGEDGGAPYLRHIDPATERQMNMPLQRSAAGSGSGSPTLRYSRRRPTICGATSYSIGLVAPSSPEGGPGSAFASLSHHLPPQEPPQPPCGPTSSLSMATTFPMPGDRSRSPFGIRPRSEKLARGAKTVSVPPQETVLTSEGKALTNPNLLPSYPRRATGKVLIHMLHETDSILLPVSAADNKVESIVIQGQGRRRGTGPDVTLVRARNNSHSDLCTEAVSPIRLSRTNQSRPDDEMMLPTSAIKIPPQSRQGNKTGPRCASPSFTDDFVEDDEMSTTSTLSTLSAATFTPTESKHQLKAVVDTEQKGIGVPTTMMDVYHQRLAERRRERAEELARYSDDSSSRGPDLTAYNHVNKVRSGESMSSQSGKLGTSAAALPNSTSTLIMIVDRRLKELNPRMAMEHPQEKKDRMRSRRFTNLMGTPADPNPRSNSASSTQSVGFSSTLTTASLETVMELNSPPVMGTAPPSPRQNTPGAEVLMMSRSSTSLTDNTTNCADEGADRATPPGGASVASLASQNSIKREQLLRFREKYQSNSLLAPVGPATKSNAGMILSCSTGDVDLDSQRSAVSSLSKGTARTHRSRRRQNPNMHYGDNLSALPAETIVHMPTLVVSSRYAACPINIMDDLKSAGSRSGSHHRTYQQSLSHKVAHPLVPMTTSASAMVESMAARGVIPPARGADATSTTSSFSSLSSLSTSQFPCFATSPVVNPPWVPRGALTAKDNLHNNELMAAREHNMVRRFEDAGVIHDRSVQTMVVKRQSAVRSSFESFAAASSEVSASASRAVGFGAGPSGLMVANAHRW